MSNVIDVSTPTGGRAAKPAITRGWARLLEDYTVLLPFLVVLIACIIFVPRFATAATVSDVFVNASIVAIAGAGMTLVIALRGLDLSVGSIQGLVTCVVATGLTTAGVAGGVAGGIAVGAIVGAINGVLVGYFRVPAFVATLGTMGIIRGAALLLADGGTISADNPALEALATSRLLFIPTPFLFAVAVLLAAYVLLHRTPFGRHVCAVGGSPEAAADSGIRVRHVTFVVFVLSGVAAALAGVLLCGQLGSATGSLGIGFELQVIAVVVLGGTSLAGGAGNLIGTMIASLLLAVISSALNLLNVPSYYQYLATGVLLIAALAFDSGHRYLAEKHALEVR
ncbi:ABC transporter permease [Rhodococcus opacus]|uniref:ABC transporter permease n=1 Tax=Rhodococcus opacus TaxID=37919 RepID=UPI001C451F59|nr:ABC transporter permease [Rhodococcus opacus]MBV6759873.1 ABC transporter permease [Rhodococcus opacus]